MWTMWRGLIVQRWDVRVPARLCATLKNPTLDLWHRRQQAWPRHEQHESLPPTLLQLLLRKPATSQPQQKVMALLLLLVVDSTSARHRLEV